MSPAVLVAALFTLGELAVLTAVVVMFPDEDDYPDCIGRLMAERIDIRNVQNEETLSTLCSGVMV